MAELRSFLSFGQVSSPISNVTKIKEMRDTNLESCDKITHVENVRHSFHNDLD